MQNVSIMRVKLYFMKLFKQIMYLLYIINIHCINTICVCAGLQYKMFFLLLSIVKKKKCERHLY